MSTSKEKNAADKTLYALNDKLFDELERLSDTSLNNEALENEIKRAEAVSKIAGHLIHNAELVLRAQIAKSEKFACSQDIPKMLGG